MPTQLCRLLDFEHPVIQAAVGAAAGPDLAAAVSNAGGLGTLVLTGLGADQARAALRRTRKLTRRPFVCNFILDFDVEAEMAVALAEGVTLISLFWGDPAPFAQRIHAAGARMMVSVGSVAEARQALQAGADILVAQGWEAGGHVRGTVTTLALVPAIVDIAGAVPVVAAGGIADGRGLAAVLTLGAQAAWIGTRFLAAVEADVHPDYRARIFAAGADDTVYARLYDGGWPDAPARTLRTPAVAAWEAAGRPDRGNRPGDDDVIGHTGAAPVYRYAAATPVAATTGDVAAMSLWAGQGVGLVGRLQPAAEIVAELVADARAAFAAATERDAF